MKISTDDMSLLNRWHFDVRLTSNTDFRQIAQQFENDVECLFEKLKDSGNHADSSAYTILNLMRLSLELRLKDNVIHFAKYSSVVKLPNLFTHDLRILFANLKKCIKSTVENIKEKYDIEVTIDDLKETDELLLKTKEIIELFDRIDKDSCSLRYPVDKKFNRFFIDPVKLNLLDVRESFNEALTFLRLVSHVFSQYTDYVDYVEEMNARMYADEMESYW